MVLVDINKNPDKSTTHSNGTIYCDQNYHVNVYIGSSKNKGGKI